ncbi:hypothetical protein [Solibacillus faecavium]|uniref:hypothetical protein n=1 Tax=Solibacillus faecavium TaxID=2762221 RepID=UPI00177EB19D|nr:hypothetical protein [Solibacillus faecavium]
MRRVTAGAPTPETTGSGRAPGKRPRNGNQFWQKQKNIYFFSEKIDVFRFVPGSFSIIFYNNLLI